MEREVTSLKRSAADATADTSSSPGSGLPSEGLMDGSTTGRPRRNIPSGIGWIRDCNAGATGSLGGRETRRAPA